MCQGMMACRRLLCAVTVVTFLAPFVGRAGCDPIVGDVRQLPQIAFSGLQFGDAAVYGTASNIDAGATRVVLWALTDHWYVQPSAASPYISVGADGSWSSPSSFWWNLVACLVDSTYRAGSDRYGHPGLDPGVVAFVQFPQVRPDLPVRFSGYDWGVKLAALRAEYGPNFWGASSEHVWVDALGKLHLRIAGSGGTWACPEIALLENHGYGTYTFDLETRVARLDARTIFRCFTAEPQLGQLQVEFAPGLLAPQTARRAVQPQDGVGAASGFTMAQTTVWSTHQIDWRPDGITFRSWNGSADDPNRALTSSWDYPGAPLPSAGGAGWYFGLWLDGGQPPASGVGDEVIVRSFKYQPLHGAEFAASGRVELLGLTDASGVSVFFSRLSGTGFVPRAAKTNATGSWSASGFQPGTVYRATPIRSGWAFMPASSQFSAGTSAQYFIGQLPAARLLVRAVVGSSRLASPAQIVVGRRAVIEVLKYTVDDKSDSTPVASFALTVPAALGSASGSTAVRLTTVAGITEELSVLSDEGFTGSLTVTTLPGSVDHLAVEPAEISLAAGQQVDFNAKGVDSYGNEFALTGANVSWGCWPAALGTIRANTGLFTAGAAGGEGCVIAVVGKSLRFGYGDAATTGTGKVRVRGARPAAFALHPNTPNPFNAQTAVRFDLAAPAQVRLEAYDSAGHRVRILVEEALPAGEHVVTWDGADDRGVGLGSGVYVVRLAAAGSTLARKALLVR